MNKHILMAALGSLACSAALAQAPKGVVERPPAQAYPSQSGGVPAEKAQQRNAGEKAAGTGTTAQRPAAGVVPQGTTPPAQLNPMASGGAAAATAEMGANARIMDANGDGMISRQEWDRHHGDMWMGMSARYPDGNVPMTEVDKRLRGTPK